MWSLENVTLRICYTEVFPFIDNVGDGITPKAMQGSIFTNITQAMGLQWVRVPAPAHIWGECDANGTCFGQLEPLQQGTADLALGPVVFTQETFDALRIIWPSHYSTLDVIAGFRSPFKAAGHFTFFNLYPTSLWYLILACVVILPVIAKLLSRFGRVDRDKVTLAEHWSPFMEIVLLETPSVQYSSNSLRILFTGWMLAAFVISSIGNATLKSVMTVLTPASKLETFEDVLKLNLEETKIRITAGTGLLDILTRADFKPSNDLAKMVMKSNGMTHPLELGATWMLRELETEQSIFILGCDVVTSFLYLPPRVKLQGTQGYTYCSKGVFGQYYSGFIASRRSGPIFEKIFNEFEKRVLWLSESPFPLLLHYENESPLVADRYINSKELKQPPPSPTTLAELSGTLIVFTFLTAATMVVFFVELSWNSREELAQMTINLILCCKLSIAQKAAIWLLFLRRLLKRRVPKASNVQSKNADRDSEVNLKIVESTSRSSSRLSSLSFSQLRKEADACSTLKPMVICRGPLDVSDRSACGGPSALSEADGDTC